MRCGSESRGVRPGTEPLLEPTSLRTKLLRGLVAACFLGAAFALAGRTEGAGSGQRALVVDRGAEPPPPAEPVAPEPAAPPAPSAANQAQQQREARARARAEVPIVLYGTSWCGACRQARSYMRAHGIAFTDLDVETDQAARATYRRLNPAHTVPTLQVGGSVLRGFNPDTFEQALASAAQARLR